MLPFIRDPVKLPNISVIYCGWSSVVFASTVFLLYSSNKYLKFGNLEILPLYSFYTASELFKWAFINSKFHMCAPFGPKESSGVVSEMLKELKNVRSLSLIRSCAILIASTISYYILAILFGAAILEGFRETFMFSLLMTIVTVLPMCLNLGHGSVIDFAQGVCPTQGFHCTLYRGMLAAWVGAWFGAFVIPLDWNRAWQIWPIPCCFGALLALTVYHFFTCVYHMGFYSRTKIVKHF